MEEGVGSWRWYRFYKAKLFIVSGRYTLRIRAKDSVPGEVVTPSNSLLIQRKRESLEPQLPQKQLAV